MPEHNNIKFLSFKKCIDRTGEVAQWQSTCLESETLGSTPTTEKKFITKLRKTNCIHKRSLRKLAENGTAITNFMLKIILICEVISLV
jgi:hypothetical protein